MPGEQTLPGKIGDFILAEAVALQNFDTGQVHIRLGIVVGKLGIFPVFIQGRTLLHLQTVAADMLRIQCQHMLQGILPLPQGLTGKTVHQIHADIPETGLTDPVESSHSLTVGVGTAQLLQQFIIVGLNAQTYPVEAFRSQPVEQLV